MSSCIVCEGNEFDFEDGAKICVECGAHELEFAELVEDEEGWEVNRSRFFAECTIEKAKEVSEDIAMQADWCSYEAYNIVLEKWTNVLMHAGASKRFKDAVFMLWVRYLQKRKIAFCDNEQDKTDNNEKLIFSKRDVIALKKAKLLQTKNSMSTAASAKEKMKRKVMKSNLQSGTKLSHIVIKQMSQTLDSTNILHEEITEEDAENFETVDVSNYEHEPLVPDSDDEIDPSSSENDESVDVEKELPVIVNPKNHYINLKDEKWDYRSLHYSPYILNLQKLLTFIYLGLLIAQEDILLMDLLRWAREGHLPYQSAGYLIPIEKQFHGNDFMLFNRTLPPALELRNLSFIMSAYLSIQALPLPNLDYILKTITDSLNLPMELRKLAFNMLDMGLKYESFSYKTIPPMEVMAAAAILLAFKVNYALDDVHEEILSDWADKINLIMEANNRPYRLFSWRKWHSYVNRLKWWANKTSFHNLSRLEEEDMPTCDAERYSQYFWTEGIWMNPLSSSKYKATHKTWDRYLLNYSLGLNRQTLQSSANKKKLFNLTRLPERDLLQQFVEENKKSPSVSEKGKKTCATAQELLNTSFSKDRFNWLFCSHELVAEFREMKKDIEIIKVSLKSPKKESKNLREFQKNRNSKNLKFVIPEPLESYWIIEHAKIEDLPTSFKWLLKTLSHLCETLDIDIYHQFKQLEKKYRIYVSNDKYL